VFAAPENTATNPIAASKEEGKGRMWDKALPNVDPMKNRGVTSPPLKLAPSVTAVNTNLPAKSYTGSFVLKEATIVGMPKPMYFVVPRPMTAAVTIRPPTNGRNGAEAMYFRAR
jgi:hypothetical protein